jgi:two-component system sensor histidine kinase and response regulator WspE
MNTLLKNPDRNDAATPARPDRNPSQRILIVEDDETIRHVNTILLSNAGFQVEAAEDGAEGWEALQTKNFDLLITDHDMPRLSGLELIKKARRARMALSIILTSGSLPEMELKRYPWLQLAATLIKPFSPGKFLETVEQVLRSTVLVNFERETGEAATTINFRNQASGSRWGINE